MFVYVSIFSFSLLSFIDMSARSVFIVVVSFLYFVFYLYFGFLLLPTWRIKPDDDDDDDEAHVRFNTEPPHLKSGSGFDYTTVHVVWTLDV